jgi:hypothetical protein
LHIGLWSNMLRFQVSGVRFRKRFSDLMLNTESATALRTDPSFGGT